LAEHPAVSTLLIVLMILGLGVIAWLSARASASRLPRVAGSAGSEAGSTPASAL
jgi:hypothetical protein